MYQFYFKFIKINLTSGTAQGGYNFFSLSSTFLHSFHLYKQYILSFSYFALLSCCILQMFLL